jgi:hypothetical protein
VTGGPYEPGEPCRNGCGLPVHGPGYATSHTRVTDGRCNIVLMQGRQVLAIIPSHHMGAVCRMLNAIGE